MVGKMPPYHITVKLLISWHCVEKYIFKFDSKGTAGVTVQLQNGTGIHVKRRNFFGGQYIIAGRAALKILWLDIVDKQPIVVRKMNHFDGFHLVYHPKWLQ